MTMSETAIPSRRVFSIAGVRMELATGDVLREFRRTRAWERTFVTAQEARRQPFEIPVGFALGSGFYESPISGGYWVSDGWALDGGGIARTFGRHANLERGTYNGTRRGWIIQFGDYVYILRGRYCDKYQMNDTHGVEWAIVDTEDFGANIAVAGRPAIFQSKLYVPLINESTGALQDFKRITAQDSSGMTDTWDAGSGVVARWFKTWGSRLARGFADTVSLVSADADPTDANDWGAAYTVGASGQPVTDAAVYDDLLFIGKPDGLYSFDESSRAHQELPDLEAVIDPDNCIGMEAVQAALFVPHAVGTVRWRPGGYSVVGEEQEGLAEGSDGVDSVTYAGGWTPGFAAYGKQIYYVKGRRASGSPQEVEPHFGVLTPSRQRVAGHTPHMLKLEDDILEHVRVVTSPGGVPYAVTLAVDESGGVTIPRAYRLPQNGQPIARDPNVPRDPDGTARLVTSFYRGADTTIRNVYEHVIVDVPTVEESLTVSRDIDNTGDVAFPAITTPGVHRLRIPASDGESRSGGPMRLTFEADGETMMRDIRVRGYRVTYSDEAFSVAVLLRDGQLEDGSVRRSTRSAQLDLVRALMQPDFTPGEDAEPPTIKDPDTGQTLRAIITGIDLRDWDASPDQTPAKIATISGLIVGYDYDGGA